MPRRHSAGGVRPVNRAGSDPISTLGSAVADGGARPYPPGIRAPAPPCDPGDPAPLGAPLLPLRTGTQRLPASHLALAHLALAHLGPRARGVRALRALVNDAGNASTRRRAREPRFLLPIAV